MCKNRAGEPNDRSWAMPLVGATTYKLSMGGLPIEKLSGLHSPSMQGPSASHPDISAADSDSPASRRSTSERHDERPLVTRAPTDSLPPSPHNVRPFPLLKPPNPTARPIASHFNLHNLLPKRSSRNDGSETDEEDHKNEKDAIAPTPIVGLLRL